ARPPAAERRRRPADHAAAARGALSALGILGAPDQSGTAGHARAPEVHGPPRSPSASGTWSFTGSMGTGRFSFITVPLLSGKVLVAGGIGSGLPGQITASAELYDPNAGTWSPTGSMTVPRGAFAAVRLNGRPV